jgi:hypothetical protein
LFSILFREQLLSKNQQREIFKYEVKNRYEDSVKKIQEKVEKNEKLIHKLAQQEQIALYSVTNTLNREQMLDTQLMYDINGCPTNREFSERDHKMNFHKNLYRSQTFKKRPKTARLYSTK